MIAQRILSPASKLAGARGLNAATADSSLGIELELGKVTEDDLYDAMDTLLPLQPKIEKALAKRHLQEGVLVMYDLTSVWMTGDKCPLAKRGHSRDGKPGTLQIEFGLLCDKDGRPVAVEVFEGNSSDPSTVATQIDKLKKRFGLAKVVLVGDRGMLTEARIREDLKPEKLDWISCLRAPAIKKLAEDKSLPMELFDERDLVAISSPDFPGERLVACRNPFLAARRAKVRDELLASTEAKLKTAQEATQRARRPLAGIEAITRRTTRILDGGKMGKHFKLEIKADGFTYERDADSIREEAALDGVYIIRSSVDEKTMSDAELVGSYKNLSRVERAFRSLKTVDLKVRPIHHRLENRVRAHILLSWLS
jgi:transposase